MSLYALIRIDLKKERIVAKKQEKELEEITNNENKKD
jgi:hypothetical protein